MEDSNSHWFSYLDFDLWLNRYISSYSVLGLLNSLQTEGIKKKLESEKEQLDSELRRIENEISEVSKKFDICEKQNEELHKMNEEKHNIVIEYLQESNKILKVFLFVSTTPTFFVFRLYSIRRLLALKLTKMKCQYYRRYKIIRKYFQGINNMFLCNINR